jgi:hypothetical protein
VSNRARVRAGEDEDEGKALAARFSAASRLGDGGSRAEAAAASRSCSRCSYVGGSPACPFCGGATAAAAMAARLGSLTQRFLLGAAHGEGHGESGFTWATAAQATDARNARARHGSSWGPPPPHGTASVARGGRDRSSGVAVGPPLKPWQQPGYHQPVPGMLRGSGNLRPDGCRSFVLCFGGRDAKRQAKKPTYPSELLRFCCFLSRHASTVQKGRPCVLLPVPQVLASAELLAPGASSWRAVAPLHQVAR